MTTMRELPIFDKDFKADPFPFYDELRASGPLAQVRLPTGVVCWLLVDYTHVRALINDDRLSKDSRFAGPSWHSVHINRDGETSRPVLEHLLTVDAPEHTRLRALVAPDFRPRRLATLRPMVEAVVSEALDRLDPDTTVDFATEFAALVPLIVICELLGVPIADRQRFRRWAELLMSADEAEQALIPGAARELSDYLLALADERRTAPDDSLFCRLVQARDRGEMTDRELAAMGFILLVAGHETTAGLLSAGLWALHETPGAWRRLCDAPQDTPRIVEELLRFCSPIEVATPRFAREDIEVGTQTIKAGDTVFLGLAAANRDGSRFDQPNDVIVDRAGGGHLAFGLGTHFCLGAGLARLEGEVSFAALSKRFPDLAPVGGQETLMWSPGLLLRGLKTLPVRLRPALDRP
jgi:cytochrome P450